MSKLSWRTLLLLLCVLAGFTGTRTQAASQTPASPGSPQVEEEEDLGPVQPNEFGIEEFLDEKQIELLHKMYFFEFRDSDQFTQLVLDYEADKKYLSQDIDSSEDQLPFLPWFVFFYTSWCPHCKKVAPTWKTYAVELGRKDKDRIRLGTVNCGDPQASKICEMVKVAEYPSLYVFESDKAYKYTGGADLGKYEDFSTFEGYKNKAPTKIERKPSLKFEEQYPQLAGLVKFQRLLLNVLPYGFTLMPFSTVVMILLVSFAVFGGFVFAFDIIKFVLGLFRARGNQQDPPVITAKVEQKPVTAPETVQEAPATNKLEEKPVNAQSQQKAITSKKNK